MSILRVPGPVVQFFHRYVDASGLPKHIRAIIPTLITAIALGNRRSYEEQGHTVTEMRRHRANISRIYKDRRFNSRELHWDTLARAIRSLAPWDGRATQWVMSLDGFALRRGACTKIRGGILRGEAGKASRKNERAQPQRPGGRRRSHAKPKSKGRGRRTQPKPRQKSGRTATKYFTFLSGVLVTDQGVRLPIPRHTCEPKAFHRGPGRPKRMKETQIDLAKLIIEKVMALLPPEVRLVVLADSYFDSKKLFALTKKLGFVLITPADSNRCFGRETAPHKSTGERIRDRGLALRRGACSRLDLLRGSEGTASFRRYGARKPGPRDRRTYWVHQERETVAGLGPVGITYSWKTPVYEPRANFRRKQYKVLICSDPSWTGERVSEHYEMRYGAIEHAIREWKGDLGLGRNTGQDLNAMERYVDMVLMTFFCLEMYRFELLDDPTIEPEAKDKARTARTRGMQEILFRDANLDLLEMVERSYVSARARRLVKRHLARYLRRGDTRACASRS